MDVLPESSEDRTEGANPTIAVVAVGIGLTALYTVLGLVGWIDAGPARFHDLPLTATTCRSTPSGVVYAGTFDFREAHRADDHVEHANRITINVTVFDPSGGELGDASESYPIDLYALPVPRDEDGWPLPQERNFDFAIPVPVDTGAPTCVGDAIGER